jgi:hypothetical protein
MLDRMGLPDRVGDLIGAKIDAMRGDKLGMLRNLIDLESGLRTRDLDRLSRQLGSFGYVSSPRERFRRTFRLVRHTYYQRVNIAPDGILGKLLGRLNEARLRRDPAYRRAIERRFNGRIVFDSKNDGRITIRRTYYSLASRARGPSGMLRLFTPMLRRLDAQLLPVLKNIITSQGINSRDDLGLKKILNDPNLSLEDKLALFLAKMTDKFDKDIEEQMKKMERHLSGKKKKGFWSSIFSGLKKLASWGIKLAAPIIGTKIGGPAGALVASKLVNSLEGGKSSSKEDKKMKFNLLNAQLQRLVEKRSQLNRLLSNILKSLHQTNMAIISNIRP